MRPKIEEYSVASSRGSSETQSSKRTNALSHTHAHMYGKLARQLVAIQPWNDSSCQPVLQYGRNLGLIMSLEPPDSRNDATQVDRTRGHVEDAPIIHSLVSEYEGKPLLGPNSLCFDDDGTLFFTDSGPFSTFSAQKGSVFCVNAEDQMLKSLAFKSYMTLPPLSSPKNLILADGLYGFLSVSGHLRCQSERRDHRTSFKVALVSAG